jgi:two-component sensor histidine kinase
VNQALGDERRRLDAIVHDEVMTTLVAAAAAARSRTPHDAHVAAQGRHAIESLRHEASLEPSGAPISVDQFVRLVKDITATVCPRAQVLGEIPGATMTLPQKVVRPFLQAIREAALNAEKHSGAEIVQVLTQVTASGRRINVRVSVTDNGRGFNTADVPLERLGVRLALEGRMQTIRGRAEIVSSPGRGTSVRLVWSGDRVRVSRMQRSTLLDVCAHPLFVGTDRTPVTRFAVTLLGLYVACTVITAPGLPRPGLFVAAMGLILVGALIGLPVLVRGPLPPWRGWLLAGLAVAATALSLAATDHGVKPDDTKWFVAPIVVLIMMAYAGGQTVAAWCGVGIYSVIVLVEAVGSEQPLSRTLVAAFAPLTWIVLESLAFLWLDAIWAAMEEADQSASEAAELNAGMFSKLVLREVWLTELRAEIDPILSKLADPQATLTDEDRAGLLLLESSLRDGIKASNFSSPALSTAIMDARLRGVQVTLVDNRGSRLPDAARRATLRLLEDIVADAPAGRIVARTAPEGYGEAVTIMQMVSPGQTQLTKVSEDGTATSASPSTPE